MVDGCQCKLVNIVSGVRRAVFWTGFCSSCMLLSFFFILENKLIGYGDDFTLMAAVPSPGVKVTAAESLLEHLGTVSEWCVLFGTKLNAMKTKTMIVSRSCTINASPVTPINHLLNCTEEV